MQLRQDCPGGDRVYAPNQSGDVVVFKASPEFEVLSVNGIGNELTNASLAVSDGQLFLDVGGASFGGAVQRLSFPG